VRERFRNRTESVEDLAARGKNRPLRGSRLARLHRALNLLSRAQPALRQVSCVLNVASLIFAHPLPDGRGSDGRTEPRPLGSGLSAQTVNDAV
jgi:hypothetical protein